MIMNQRKAEDPESLSTRNFPSPKNIQIDYLLTGAKQNTQNYYPQPNFLQQNSYVVPIRRNV